LAFGALYLDLDPSSLLRKSLKVECSSKALTQEFLSLDITQTKLLLYQSTFSLLARDYAELATVVAKRKVTTSQN
jgi:hypothetical protein